MYLLYEARHLRLEKTVWIQELDAGAEVADQAQLRARAWGDCSAVEGMVHICDQFVLPAELDDLPVAVEKIYHQEDGMLSFFACVTECAERTDYVYELCELFYEGITGKKPPQKQIRILYDEMEPLSKCQPKLDGALAAIIEKGLQVEPEKSFASLSELEMALADWEKQQEKKKRGVPYRIAGCVLCAVLLGIGLLGLYQKYEEQICFLGVETQLVLLVPDADMTLKEYLEAVDELKEQIGQASGRSPYPVQD